MLHYTTLIISFIGKMYYFMRHSYFTTLYYINMIYMCSRLQIEGRHLLFQCTYCITVRVAL